jgi:hypothetical protein
LFVWLVFSLITDHVSTVQTVFAALKYYSLGLTAKPYRSDHFSNIIALFNPFLLINLEQL